MEQRLEQGQNKIICWVWDVICCTQHRFSFATAETQPTFNPVSRQKTEAYSESKIRKKCCHGGPACQSVVGRIVDEIANLSDEILAIPQSLHHPGDHKEVISPGNQSCQSLIYGNPGELWWFPQFQ